MNFNRRVDYCRTIESNAVNAINFSLLHMNSPGVSGLFHVYSSDRKTGVVVSVSPPPPPPSSRYIALSLKAQFISLRRRVRVATRSLRRKLHSAGTKRVLLRAHRRGRYAVVTHTEAGATPGILGPVEKKPYRAPHHGQAGGKSRYFYQKIILT